MRETGGLMKIKLGIAAALALALGVAAVASGVPGSASAQSAGSAKSVKKPEQAAHKVAIQVNQNDKAVMDLALNNVANILEYYKAKGEPVAVEVVAYGPGLHMLRDDTSPVKARVAAMSLQHSTLRFTACANTQSNMSKAESKSVPIVSEAKLSPSGVVRLMELQREGYAYIRP